MQAFARGLAVMQQSPALQLGSSVRFSLCRAVPGCEGWLFPVEENWERGQLISKLTD